jgi:hypothetical protein
MLLDSKKYYLTYLVLKSFVPSRIPAYLADPLYPALVDLVVKARSLRGIPGLGLWHDPD